MFMCAPDQPLSISQTPLLCHLGPSFASAHVAIQLACHGFVYNERTGFQT